MMEAVNAFGTPISIYQIKRCQIQEHRVLELEKDLFGRLDQNDIDVEGNKRERK
jgi:hypothetical protein